MKRGAVALLLGLATLLAAGCGGQARGGSVAGEILSIYASMPLTGVDAEIGRQVLDGEKVALAGAGGRAGRFTLNLTALNSTDPSTMRASPAMAAANARKASTDRGTIAYLGEVEPGASAVSVVILNEGDTLQVSPLDTFSGLTQPEAQAPDEPTRYYPSGFPTFARIVPDDAVQARALASWLGSLRAHRLFLLDDQSLYGQRLAGELALAARRAGVAVVGSRGQPEAALNSAPVLAAVRHARPDAIFYGAENAPGAADDWNGLAAALPEVRMLAGGALATPSFAAALSAPAAARTYLTSPALPLSAYGDAVRSFERSYRADIGRAPGPWSILGYEAMAATIDAIRRAGIHARDRHVVIEQFLHTSDRDSVLGHYSITAQGATTRTALAGYRVRGGRLVLARLFR